MFFFAPAIFNFSSFDFVYYAVSVFFFLNLWFLKCFFLDLMAFSSCLLVCTAIFMLYSKWCEDPLRVCLVKVSMSVVNILSRFLFLNEKVRLSLIFFYLLLRSFHLIC